MREIIRCPGVVAVEREAHFGFVRWEPAAVWSSLQPKLDEWKGQVHLVTKASLSPSLREALYLLLPEDQIPPDRRLDLAMVRATSLVTVPDELRATLLAQGVRVWTVGYHRNPAIFRLVGEGGGEPTLWIEQGLYELFDPGSGVDLSPILPGPPLGRPPAIPWYGWNADIDRLDRVLRAATGDVLDEPSVLLAHEIAREGFGNLHEPEAERRGQYEMKQMIAADPEAAEEGCYADLPWTWQRRWKGDEDAAATPELARAVAALASAGGPTSVEVAGIGAFWREELPPMRLIIAPPRESEGCLPAIPGLVRAMAPTHERELRVRATHRYARHLEPGARWEI